MVDWFNENWVALALIAGSITVLVLIFSWDDRVSPFAVIKRIPAAIRMVVAGLFLVFSANLAMLAPGIAAALIADPWLGEWSGLLLIPGCMVGYCLLTLAHRPLLVVYRLISGIDD